LHANNSSGIEDYKIICHSIVLCFVSTKNGLYFIKSQVGKVDDKIQSIPHCLKHKVILLIEIN
jgi:hypothetical protein